MNGLWQLLGKKSSRRRAVVLLVLTSWAIQGLFYWGVSEKQRAEAAIERERSRERGFLHNREALQSAINEARREKYISRQHEKVCRHEPPCGEDS